MKVKGMGITEILRKICAANEIKSSESFSKQRTQLIIAAHNCHNYGMLKLNVVFCLSDLATVMIHHFCPTGLIPWRTNILRLKLHYFLTKSVNFS